MATDEDLTTAAECATRWGISRSTARRYLAHVAHVDRDPATGAMRYRQADADAARAALPGRGHRSDRSASRLDEAAVQQLLDDGKIPARHRALWALLASEEPIRVSEALALKVGDVDPGEKAAADVVQREGRRTVPLSDRTAALIRETAGGREADAPLFANQAGRVMTREGATRAARTLVGRSLHDFHGFAKAEEERRSEYRTLPASEVDLSGHIVDVDRYRRALEEE